MFSTISLLVLACAITINAQENQCSEVHIGNVPTSHPVVFQPVSIPPYKPDWEVIIPPVQECVYGVSGVHAFICDADVAPTGYFIDFYTLKLHRNGNLMNYGSVIVTVYCIV